MKSGKKKCYFWHLSIPPNVDVDEEAGDQVEYGEETLAEERRDGDVGQQHPGQQGSVPEKEN